MARWDNLGKAMVSKDDEFYTRYEVVENEMKYYRDYFKGSVVYLPFDDYRYSNFYKYFRDNYKDLGLRGVLASNLGAECFIVRLTQDESGELVEQVEDINNGDYRSLEVRGLYDEADIIVSNPPFSRFTEIIRFLSALRKDFILIGSNLKVSGVDFWSRYIKGDAYLGVLRGKSLVYDRPDGDVKKVLTTYYTTLKPDYVGLPPKFTKRYAGNEDEYELYENYTNVLNVDKVGEIPVDYSGLMGVPLTFLDNYYEETSIFNVYGILKDLRADMYSSRVDLVNDLGYDRRVVEYRKGMAQVDGKSKFLRVLIGRKTLIVLYGMNVNDELEVTTNTRGLNVA